MSRACSNCGKTGHHYTDCPVVKENLRREAKLEILERVRFIVRGAIEAPHVVRMAGGPDVTTKMGAREMGEHILGRIDKLIAEVESK